MKLLLKNGTVVNVFVGELERADVLIENGKIIGVGDYSDIDADTVEDITGKYVCPGFIDMHMHEDPVLPDGSIYADEEKAVFPEKQRRQLHLGAFSVGKRFKRPP